MFGGILKKSRTGPLTRDKNPALSYRPLPFHPCIITKIPLRRVLQGVMKKWTLDPRKPRKMPGLPNGAFLKNPIKRPDSIRAFRVEEIKKGVQSDVFKIWVDFPCEKKEG